MSCRKPTSARLFTTALLTALLASAWTESANALPTSSTRTFAEPRFHIQAIEVRGTRHVSTPVVASESLLEPGQVYTESELRDAVRRIRRLPFVLEANFALSKGREHGTYVLLVDIVETRRFFYQADLAQNYFGEPLAFDSNGRQDENFSTTLTAGGRLFLGRHGLLFAAAGNEGTRIGYTHYNLLGRGVTLRFGLAREDICCATSIAPRGLDPLLATWIDEAGADNASLAVGVPLDAHQMIRANVSWRQSAAGRRRPTLETDGFLDFRDRTEEEVRLAWTYDNTDDPVLPFEGTSLVVAVDYKTLEAELSETGTSTEMSSDLLRLSVLGRRHWPVARRHSFAAGLSLAIGRSRVDLPRVERVPLEAHGLTRESLDNWELTTTIRHTLRLHEAKKAHSHRRVYWQNDLEYSWNALSPDRLLPHGPINIVSASSALVLRSAWGLVRLGLRWIHVGDAL